ncbi:GyrI-like domain-containing protein [Micrococcales bacterium 31B]|nr:GyrI-like domain-containing protein [Micrococcales bacterium 31B]
MNPHVKMSEPLRVAAVERRLGFPPFPDGEIAGMFDAAADDLLAVGARPELGVALYAMDGSGTAVTCGFVADAPVVPGLVLHELGSIEVASVLHHGSMETIGDSWGALMAWCEAEGYAMSGPCREIYLESADRDDMSDWVTELQQPVERRG